MSNMTYESIHPMTVKAEQHGNTIFCIFKCPISGHFVSAYLPVIELRTAPAPGDISAVRKGLGSVFRNALGLSTPPQRTAVTTEEPLGDDEMCKAIVMAFQRVASAFLWDPAGGRWISTELTPELSTDFDRQLRLASPKELGERAVLARILAAVANADGKIAPEEREFLEEFIDPVLGTVDMLLAQPPPTKEDLEILPKGAARQTALMLAWTLALTDKDLAQQEERLLAALARALGLSEDQAERAKHFAQIYLVDRMIDLYAFGGLIDPVCKETVTQMAACIGVSASEAAKAIHHYQQRNGLD